MKKRGNVQRTFKAKFVLGEDILEYSFTGIWRSAPQVLNAIEFKNRLV